MPPTQKMRIILSDHRVLDVSAQQILETAERTEQGSQVLFLCPQQKECLQSLDLLINKDSREYFELRTHKRLIDILEPSSKTIDSLTSLSVPSGSRYSNQVIDRENNN